MRLDGPRGGTFGSGAGMGATTDEDPCRCCPHVRFGRHATIIDLRLIAVQGDTEAIAIFWTLTTPCTQRPTEATSRPSSHCSTLAPTRTEEHDVGTPLHLAAIRGHQAAVAALLGAGADPNRKNSGGLTPLHWPPSEATPRSSPHCSTPAPTRTCRTTTGHTPLHSALDGGHPAVITALLSAGADPNGKDRGGNTPLHWAASEATPAVITALLDAGADPNGKNSGGSTPLHWAAGGGSTPLHWAAGGGHPAAITALLDAGADPNGKNSGGNTSLHWRPGEATPRSSPHCSTPAPTPT